MCDWAANYIPGHVHTLEGSDIPFPKVVTYIGGKKTRNILENRVLFALRQMGLEESLSLGILYNYPRKS